MRFIIHMERQVFVHTSDGVLKITEEKIDVEKKLQNMIEKSLDALFPNLEFLESEYRLDSSNRADTLAYDSKMKCFAVIEYKKMKDYQILDQAGAYRQIMKERPDKIVLTYNNKRNTRHSPKDFNWDDSYAILIAPEFSERQIKAQASMPNMRLYTASLYETGVLILENTADSKDNRRRKSRNGDISPDLFEKFYKTKLGEKSRPLFNHMDKTLRERFQLNRDPKVVYVKYVLGSGTVVCSISRGRNRLKLHYDVKLNQNLLEESNFLRDVSKISHDGVGDYESNIDNIQDFERAVPFIERVWKYKNRAQM